jgi:GNAT superfamily N-acetyltransferase
MPEFGACGEGFAINDPEVDYMHRAYAAPRCAYFVVERDGVVCGGGGIAPLAGAEQDVCELRKMYFLPELRGLGAGTALMERCLDTARLHGFRQCYIETLRGMDAAMRLYALRLQPHLRSDGRHGASWLRSVLSAGAVTIENSRATVGTEQPATEARRNIKQGVADVAFGRIRLHQRNRQTRSAGGRA